MNIFYSIVFVPYIAIFIFLFGLCIGSFLNVCIWRIPRSESIIFVSSHCPNCYRKIPWHENIPLLSWIMLSGKCKRCHYKIPFRYFLVELLTAIFFELDYLRIVTEKLPIVMLIAFFTATALFIITFFVDIKHKIIPNKVTYFVIIFSFIMAFCFPEYVGADSRVAGLLNSFFGFCAGGGTLSVLAYLGKKIFKKEVLGSGDVKFVAAVGACFGLVPYVWFFVIFIGSLLGLIFGIFLILIGKKRLSSVIAFGPFLAIAGYLWILFGPELVKLYFNLILSV